MYAKERRYLVGIDGLGSANHNGLNTDVAERCIDEGAHEAEEVSSGARDIVVVHPRARVVPVSESDCLTIRSASSRDDD